MNQLLLGVELEILAGPSGIADPAIVEFDDQRLKPFPEGLALVCEGELCARFGPSCVSPLPSAGGARGFTYELCCSDETAISGATSAAP